MHILSSITFSPTTNGFREKREKLLFTRNSEIEIKSLFDNLETFGDNH